MVKVLLERQVKKQNYSKLMEHLKELRANALRQPGYVSGETLVRGVDILEVLVISTWISEEHWKAWQTYRERIVLGNIIEQLLEEPVKVKVFQIAAEEEE